MSDVTSTSATTTPVSLSDMKSHLNITTTGDDAYIETLMLAATKHVEEIANRVYVTQTRTLKMRGFDDPRYVHENRHGQREIYIPRSPLATISSITYVNTSGTTATLSTSIYSVSTGDSPGRVREAYNEVWPDVRDQPDNVTVTYTAGYGAAQTGQPEDAVHAIKMLCGHWYRNREAAEIGTLTKELEFGVNALLGPQTIPDYA